VRAIYSALYLRLRGVYRFALADARVELPTAAALDALVRSARLADIDAEHLRSVAQLAESAPDETERGMVEASMISHVLPDAVLRWCADHDDDGACYSDHSQDADRGRRGNKMARERMSILYDQSMARRALVLGTSNKTELLLGYGTLFGDMASALNPIGDLYKTQVFALARELDLPHSVLTKPPSADLWAGQSDEEELGIRYAVVDRVLHLLVDERRSRSEVIALGFDPADVDTVAERVRGSQYKRRPPVIAKLSSRTIDREFRYPRDWGR